MCARWRSTAAIAAAVTASTIWFKEGEGIGAGGIYLARGEGARGQALRYTGPKYSRRKRWCIAIVMLRSIKYKRGCLPPVSFSPWGVQTGVTVRAREGGPFSVPSAAVTVVVAALSGCGGVVSGRIRLIGAVRRNCAEGFAEPSRGIWGATGRFQEVTEA